MIRIFASAASGVSVRILALLTNLVGTPMALHVFGAERFASVLVLIGLGSITGLANLGFSRVVALRVAKAVGRNRPLPYSFLSASIGAALMVYSAAGLALGVLTAGIAFRFAPTGMSPATWVAGILLMVFAYTIWFIASVFEGIDLGRHRVYRLHVCQIASYALALLGIIFVLPWSQSILLCIALLSLAFLPGSVAHGLVVWREIHPNLTFSLRRVIATLPYLLRSSLHFTVASLTLTLIFQVLPGVMGAIAGPVAVFNLSLFMRIMLPIGAIVMAFTQPLSSAVLTAISSGAHDELRRVAVMTAIAVGGFCLVAGLSFAVAGDRILTLWLRHDISLELQFRLAGGAIIVLSGLQLYLSALVAGLERLAALSMAHLFQLVLVIPAAGLGYAALGIEGVLWGVAVSQLASSAVLMIASTVRGKVGRRWAKAERLSYSVTKRWSGKVNTNAR